jgi:type IV pilus assembly protein PilY1
MKRKLFSTFLFLIAFLVTFCISLTVRAQFIAPVDNKAKIPNVLLLIDSSGSMTWALDGGNADCKDELNPKKARYTILGEVLTGTVDDLDCWSGIDPLNIDGPPVPLMSNSERHQPGGQNCVPVLNLDTDIINSLKAHPFGWPFEAADKDNSSAIAYCGGKTAMKFARCFNSSGWSNRDVCGKATIGWNQAADGLLDTYNTKIRFGMASFDSLPFPGFTTMYSNKSMLWWTPETGGALSYVLDPQCRNGTMGTYCLRYLFPYLYYQFGEWSYWHGTGSTFTSTWLTGTRSTAMFPTAAYVGGVHPFINADVGIRNSRALPHKGRLIGFGHPDATVTDTQAHNDMVQDSILGLSTNLEHNTPLAAMLRDAYEFVANDTTTNGVTIPHPNTAAPTLVTIGPQTDPYFSSTPRCRDTLNILITDGEPTGDINDRPSYWAGLLAATEDVNTIVFGIGLEKARWKPGTSIVEKSCDDLKVTDYDSSSTGTVMCTRDGGLGWKYSDVSPFNNGLTDDDKSAIRACCNLLEIAIHGDPTNKYGQLPYFPDNQAALKQTLDGILKNIAGTTVSRTVPVFANITSTFQPGNAPASYYELRSALIPTAKPTAGVLERVRYACDNTAEPVIQTIEEVKGDVFNKNLDVTTTAFPRKFFTAIPLKSGGVVKPMWSVRPAVVNEDWLLGSPSTTGNFIRLNGSAPDLVPPHTKDTTVVIDSFASTINSTPGSPTTAELLNITNTDRTTCLSQVGTNVVEECAKRVLQWYGGSSQVYSLGAGKFSPSRDPSVCGGWDKCSPLGAIYRSNPVIVSPPDANASEQSYSNRSDSFYSQEKTRPTMLYAQTIDGMLHAFVMSKNATNPDPYAGVPVVDKLENNELWSFIPPAILPQIWPNFKVEARLLDGPLAVGNVVFSRSQLETAEGDPGPSGFRTVLVGSSGYGETGFYYAMDVTNPMEPRFLWQLVNSSTGGALFGKVLPGAAITTLKIKDPKDGQIKQIGVAILPGGRDPGTPTTTTTRRISSTGRSPIFSWGGVGYGPRTTIRNWGTKLASRSVTIVELATGRIIARLAGEWADNPGKTSTTTCGGSPSGASSTLCGLNPNVIINPSRVSFDSPITSTPVVFPSGTAQVSNRAYVGDADGTLWRIDLSDVDPMKWSAEIAWDAYNHTSIPNNSLKLAYAVNGIYAGMKLNMSVTSPVGALLGQPIEQAPVISVDSNNSVTVTFSTGDNDSFNTYSPGMLNMMTTFVDAFDNVNEKFTPTISSTQGTVLAFVDGGRVTGPPTLFDGKLFFSFFSPQTGNTCTSGSGGWCAMDYVSGNNASPVATIDTKLSTPAMDTCSTFDNGEIAFGLSINAVPSCLQSEDNFNDQFLAGQYNSYSGSKGLSYQLVLQTSQGGSSENGSMINTTRMALPAPRSKSRLQSWVSVMQ